MTMKEKKKTKQQLLAELVALHQRIEELEKSDADHRKTGTSLRKGEEKYRTLLESTLDFVFTVDRKGMFTYINPRFEMVTGHNTADLIGRPFTTVIPPESAEIATTQFKRGVRGEKGAPYEIEIIHKNGSRIPVEFNVTTLHDEHNKPIGRYGIGRDITERKRVESVLKENEDRLHSIVEGSPISTFVIGKDHRVVYWNRALEELSQIKAQEVIGTRGQWRAFYDKERPCMADLLVDEDFDKITEWYAGRCKKSDLLDEAYEALDFFPALGNGGKWLRFTAAAIRDTKGNLIGALETLEDMTGRKQAEKKLIESEEKYRLVVENAGEAIFVVQDGRLKFVNRATIEVIGYSAEVLTSKPFTEFIYPDDRELVFERYTKRIRGDAAVPIYSFRVVTKDGVVKWVEIHSAFISLWEGKPATLNFISDITERKRTDEMLRQSISLLSATLESTTDGILVVDKDGRVLIFNKRFLSMWNIPESLATSRDDNALLNFVVDQLKDPNSFIEKVHYLYSHPEAESFDMLEFEDGRIFERYSQPQKMGDEIIGRVWSFRDVTRRRHAEDELRESQRLLSEIIEFLPDSTLVIDRDGTVIAWNRAIEEITGVKAGKMLGKGNYEYALPFYGDRRPILIDLALHPNPEMEKKYTAIQRQGDKVFGEAFTPNLPPGNVHLSATASVLRDSKGEIYAAIECIRDNTYRRQAEEALQKSEEKFRFITERMSDVIWTLDSHFMVQYVSPSVSKALGYTPEERIKQSIVERITPESLANVQEVLRRELRIDRESGLDPDRTVTLELEYYHKDGPKVWHESVISAIRDNGGNIIGYHGASRDITERKKIEKERQRLEERLRRAEKMEALGSLAGGVAHDLNNVLGVIVGYSELLREKIPAEDNLKRYVQNILNSSQRAAAIIQDLLTLARRGVAVSEVVNLNAVIYDYIKSPEFERLKAYHPYVTIETDVEKALLHIKGSPVHLEKTLMNLVSNAVEAISDRGSVMIRTENRYLDKPIRGYDDVREGDYVVLTVSDTGKGISAVEIEKIFEPFYTKKVMGRSGTGLGLTVVWGTVKDHDGYIDVHSEDGNGSIFTIYFPATREELAADQQEISPDQYMGMGESILVVDDIKEQRELAVAMLNRIGYHAAAVSSGEEAVSYIRTNKIDLMVLDMIMDPGIDGLETYRRVLEINPKQKAIIVSGFSETERVKKAQEIGAGAYVRKPYILEKIGLAVKGELLKVNE
jgi:two-component system cell cycle sensor histidine kinase/response regulator CckA